MITRRNWLLRCSILINVAVLLYICSHVIIGNSNVSIGPSFVMQDDYNVKPQSHQQPQQQQQQAAQIVYQEAANDAVQVSSFLHVLGKYFIDVFVDGLCQRFAIMLCK